MLHKAADTFPVQMVQQIGSHQERLTTLEENVGDIKQVVQEHTEDLRIIKQIQLEHSNRFSVLEDMMEAGFQEMRAGFLELKAIIANLAA